MSVFDFDFQIEIIDFVGEDLTQKKDGGIIRCHITRGEGFATPNDGAIVEGKNVFGFKQFVYFQI